ncbi:DUF3460 family protein [Thauera sp. CAU 1555]|uniref:DUF3460 family protein n=1 Tax=Thauera sedimentorum TaxID=2767595 RepID=A0ABR9BCR0_9RHOO|nr:DUF3460 family protein [Thauera sedimentorum]MBC9073218.1 DUF3460 family protein [Thauera sedimentorum]MBD8504137.1 DUF3460 family protein [Thauera sedimentorum]
MAIYESEHTKFMREWLEKHPQELEEQKKGRALWWDKPQDLDSTARNAQSRVPVKPYYYDANH